MPTRHPLRLALALAALAAGPAWAACPAPPDREAERRALMASLRFAPGPEEAQRISARLWTIWTDAPDDRAQRLLSGGMGLIARRDLPRARGARRAGRLLPRLRRGMEPAGLCLLPCGRLRGRAPRPRPGARDRARACGRAVGPRADADGPRADRGGAGRASPRAAPQPLARRGRAARRPARARALGARGCRRARAVVEGPGSAGVAER